jgi:hypothetical protein
LRKEFFARKVAFDAISLLALRVEHYRSRRPRHVKALEPDCVLFDIRFERNEILVDVSADFLVLI